MKLLCLLRSLIFSFLFLPIWTVVLSSIGVIWFWITGKRDFVEWCGYTWARGNLVALGLRLDVEGLENIPEGGCLMLFNHSSFVDIFAMAALLPKIHFGAKIELFSIPFFGAAMRAAGILPITRQNLANAIRVLTEAEARARQGEKFALAPEGKRNSVEKLLPFKSGPFIFAIHAQVPLVPILIKGAARAWPKGALLPGLEDLSGIVRVKILPPVPTTGVTLEQKHELMQKVRGLMLQYIPSADPYSD